LLGISALIAELCASHIYIVHSRVYKRPLALGVDRGASPGVRRADAVLKPLPGELSTKVAKAFFGRLVDFGGPPHELMATGDDPPGPAT
jgi:hypothetical protein